MTVKLIIQTDNPQLTSKWEDVQYLLYDVLEDMSKAIFTSEEVDLSGQPKRFRSCNKDSCVLEVIS